MEDKVDKIIRENKTAFEEDAPKGHFERFEQRLNQKRIRPEKNRKKLYLQIAAAVVFVLMATNQVRMYLQVPDVKPVTLGSISPEYSEVEFYYVSAIGQGMEHWEKLTADGMISQDEQDMMKKEILEFDETYKRLQQDLVANPDDERVINAMLEMYQTRLNIINLIIDKLEHIKKLKANNHEF